MLDFHAAGGSILTVHPVRLDSFLKPFPCFETDGRYDGGMSGGPIVSATTGTVCAVVCSGLDFAADAVGHTSYGALLSPALTLDVLVSTSTGGTETLSVLELVRRGLVVSDGRP